jgi:hypothetical protein
MKGDVMNKDILISKHQVGQPDEEMPELKEQDFARAKPNRFTKGVFQLDKDVSSYFKTSKEVNDALRLIIQLNKIVSHP